MTGRFRLGKMSIDIRVTAKRLPSATALTSTITVYGRLMAKTIGFIGSVRSGRGESLSPGVRPGPRGRRCHAARRSTTTENPDGADPNVRSTSPGDEQSEIIGMSQEI